MTAWIVRNPDSEEHRCRSCGASLPQACTFKNCERCRREARRRMREKRGSIVECRGKTCGLRGTHGPKCMHSDESDESDGDVIQLLIAAGLRP